MYQADAEDCEMVCMLGSCLCKKLIEARQKAGMSVECLAAASGMTVEDILAIENGEKIARLSEFSKLIDACGYFAEENILCDKECKL